VCYTIDTYATVLEYSTVQDRKPYILTIGYQNGRSVLVFLFVDCPACEECMIPEIVN